MDPISQFNNSIPNYTASDQSEPSVAERIMKYVVPGAIVGGVLGVATCGVSCFVLTLSSVGPVPEIVREILEGEVSFQQFWDKMDTFNKVILVGLGLLLGACAVGMHL